MSEEQNPPAPPAVEAPEAPTARPYFQPNPKAEKRPKPTAMASEPGTRAERDQRKAAAQAK
jgi:hypothetical protein